MSVTRLPPSQADAAVDVLCDAFHDYPVMHYVLGESGDYDHRLRMLSGFFVFARTFRNDPILAVRDGDRVVGVATVVLPDAGEAPAAFLERREAVWKEIGAAELARYEAFGAATKPFAIDRPHHHLSMIGVRHSHAGRGLGRVLLDAVHELAESDPASHGVSLTTELEKNVSLYTHFGYELVGHSRVGNELQTWGFFRPNSTRA